MEGTGQHFYPKVKVKGKKACICDGVSSTAVLVYLFSIIYNQSSKKIKKTCPHANKGTD